MTHGRGFISVRDIAIGKVEPRRRGIRLGRHARFGALGMLVLAAGFGLTTPVRADRPGPSVEERAQAILARMTLDEKLGMVHGAGFGSSPVGSGGFIPGIARLHIPDQEIVDSGSGLNMTDRKANVYPAPLAMASSWQPSLFYDLGRFTAQQARTLGVTELIGGTINLTREPRSGRVFEMLGEDPLLSGKLMAQRVIGTQSQGVIATVKHFAVNGQETNRTQSDSQVDERTLRELYLKNFEIVIRDSNPGNVMCSYNRLNGDKTCESKWLLTHVLKGDWGYDGVVQSDWVFAVTDTARAVNAGLDEEQPGNGVGKHYPFDEYSRLAVNLKQEIGAGVVPPSRLDDMVLRKLRVMLRRDLIDNPPRRGEGTMDLARGKALSEAMAEQSMVLLKNEGRALPLKARQHILVIGGNADKGVMSGGGSSAITPPGGNAVPCLRPEPYIVGGMNFFSGCAIWMPSAPLAALRSLAPQADVQFMDGKDSIAAARAAAKADVTIVFATQFATEDKDLPDLNLPGPTQDPANQAYDQNELIETVAHAARKTVVVLETAGPVTMPWVDHVDSILEAWYPGEDGGMAIARTLLGLVDPSGRLPLTFPASEADLPQKSIMADKAVYSERLEMGYRGLEARGIKPLFAFGHGLSYTAFSYANMHVARDGAHDVTVTFDLKNIGPTAGASVPQIYAGLPASAGEPPKRLVGWDKVNLKPGETRQISIRIPESNLRIWDEQARAWGLKPGGYTLYLGRSSQDIVAQQPVALD